MRFFAQEHPLRFPALRPGQRLLLAAVAAVALLPAAWASPAQAAPGDVTTVAGNGADQSNGDGGQATAAGIGMVEGVAFTPAGLYITHNNGHLVRRVDAAGVITTLAGGGASSPGNGGPATSASLLDTVEGIIRHRSGTVYFSERHRIRSVSTLGIINTVAGTGIAGYSGDGGPAGSARIDRPHGIAFDLNGGGYLADCARHVVRRVSAFGTITTVAGTGTAGYTGDGGAATSARLDCPTDVAIDRQGNFYIADRNNDAIRKVTTAGTITTVAGDGTPGYSGDGAAATSAQLRTPRGIAVDGADQLFIADADNHAIRRVDTGGTIATVAGTGVAGFAGDGGPATAAQFDQPHYLDFDPPTGDLYLSDRNNHRVRRIEALGVQEVPPTVNIDSSPASPGADSTPTWTFSVSPAQAVIYECRLTAGATVISDWATCTSPRTYDLSGEPDGTYTFEVRAVTLAGTGAPTSNNYDLQTAPDPLDHFAVDPISDQSSGQPFSVTVTAKTVSGVTDTSFNGTVDFTSGAGSVTPATSNSFVNGVLTQSVRLTGDYAAGATLGVAGAGGVTGTSNAFLLSDGKYYFKQTSAHTGAGCAGAYTQRDMEEGYAGQDPEATHRRFSSGAETINFCSPPFPAAQPLSAGVTTVRAYVDNTHGSTCNISATLLLNGTTPLGSASRTIPGVSPLTLYTWTLNTPATTIGAGDKLNVRFQMQAVKACQQTSIHYGGTVNRSHVELAAGTPAPTITSGPGPTGSSRSPTWGFAGDPGSTLECRLEDAAGAPVAGYDWAGCGSPQTYDLTGLADGGYTFAVRQTDGGGTTSPAARSDYVLDTAAPGVPTIDSGPASPDNDTNPSFTFSGEDDTAFECRLRRMNGTDVSGWSSCTSPRAYSLAAELDGAYEFSVRQSDAAGNTSVSADSWYVLDTTPGVAPAIDTAPSSPGSNPLPTWAFSGEPGATFECRVERGATVVIGWGTCSSPQTFDLSGEPDGTYTFSVRQIDGPGNVSPAATDDYALDSQAPGAPSIDSGPASPDNDTSPTFTFSGEAGGSFECRLEDGSGQPVSGFDWATCSSPRSYDLSGSPDGAYSFAVRQIDDAGSTGPAATRPYVLDTTPPPAPVFTTEPPLTGSATNPSWSFTGEGGATFECRVERGATLVFDWVACSSPHSPDLSSEPDGLYVFSVRAIDAAGNTGGAQSGSYDLDRSPPATPVVTGGPGAVANNASPAWSFTVEAGALSECRVERGAATVSDWTPCASPASYDLTAETDGTYRFLVRARDTADNVGAPAQSEYVLDRTPPPAPTIDSTPGAVGSSRTPAWGFSGEPGAVHECRLEGEGGVVSDWTQCNGSASYDLAGAPDGSYTFAVRSRDEAGNVGPAADSTYRLDATGAAVSIDSGPGPLGNSPVPTWTFSGEAGAGFECLLERDGAVVADWAPCASPQAYDLSGQPDGDYTFRVRSADPSGNVGAVASYAYTLDRVAPPPPTFTGSPGALGRDTTPRWELAVESSATGECRLLRNGVAPGDWRPCAGAISRDLSGTGDGAYALTARATDGAGNVSGTSLSAYRLDTTAPAAPEITDGPGADGRARRVSWAFTGEPAATFECRLTRGATVLDRWSPCSSPAGFTLASEGAHVFRVRASDQAGNQGPSTSSDYRLLAPLDPAPRDDGPDPRPAEGRDPAPAPEPAAPSSSAPPGPTGSLPDPEANAAGAPPEDEDRAREKGVSKQKAERPQRDTDEDTAGGAGPGISKGGGGDASGPGPGAEKRPAGDHVGDRLLDALGDTAAFVGRNLDKTGFPVLLVLLVLGYIAFQNRLDSRDPKLALAPIHADRDLEFLPPPTPTVAMPPAVPQPMTS